ncbi:hypothetical protein ACE38F_00465 [Bacillus mycoides]|uniref:hypothetical protein n=1 Tax=Bacillus mycoides TaxID=1405 RepID=UPI0035CC4F31
MKKKFIASGLICIILTSSVAFYIYSDSQEVEMKQSSPVSLLKVSSKKSVFKTNDITQVIHKADFEKTYNDVKELALNADIIVEGTIIESQYFDFNTNTFTRSKIQVSKSFNNAVNPGDIIQFIEIGGVTTKGKLQEYDPEKIKIQKNELNEPIEVLLDGAPTSKKNENVLLFAKEDMEDFFKLKEKLFISLNSYQGKFTIDKNNKVKRYTEKSDHKLNKPASHSTNKYNSGEANLLNDTSLETTLPDMENQITSSLKNN